MDTTEFIVEKPVCDPASGTIRFGYRLGTLEFIETVRLPEGFEETRLGADPFLALLDLTAFVLGVSYYKLKAPLVVRAPEIGLSKMGRAFVLDVYENGLGEFYARNDLRRFGKISLLAEGIARPGGRYEAGSGILLPIGGGKDSLVSVDLLKNAGLDFTPFAVNPKGPILSSIEAVGRPAQLVTRTLDPEMIRLSGEPGFYNGHVPSTAINSTLAALTAVLFGHDSIVLSNERSADEGNVTHDGRQANHQHSKSFDFERLIADVLGGATGGTLSYYSLLRPLSEVQIARLFARETRFDHVFSSCNRNFRLSGSPEKLWCGECPKCQFVFLILAAAMPPGRLISIFGQDLLDQERNEAGFRALSGLAGQKPWECVGEILEAAAALWQLTKDADWATRKLVRKLQPDLERQYGGVMLEAAWQELLTPSSENALPGDVKLKVHFDGI